MVNRDVFSNIRSSDGDPYVVYANVLSSWGIMCPHPQTRRLYGGYRRHRVAQPVSRYFWYECECCGTLAPNTDVTCSVDVTKKKKL